MHRERDKNINLTTNTTKRTWDTNAYTDIRSLTYEIPI